MRALLAVLFLSLYVGFPLRSFGQTAPAANSSNAVATVGGQPISEQELIELLGSQWLQLRRQEYELKTKALDSLILQKLIAVEAKNRGISAQKFLEEEVDSKVAEPSDGEVEAFFLAQDRTGLRFNDVKEQFRANLKQVRIQKARQAYADSLRQKTDVAVLLRPPSVDVAYDPDRVIGDPEASVTIIEFSDFQCPFCKKTEATLKDLLAKYNGRVRLAYRDFPLREIHGQALKAAEASRCAGEQGKFWEYHDALFADQSKLDDASLTERARKLNLDEKFFQACLASGKFKDKIEADRQDGGKAGVAGTPSFFINGAFLSGAQPLADFEKIIDAELASYAREHTATTWASK